MTYTVCFYRARRFGYTTIIRDTNALERLTFNAHTHDEALATIALKAQEIGYGCYADVAINRGSLRHYTIDPIFTGLYYNLPERAAATPTFVKTFLNPPRPNEHLRALADRYQDDVISRP